MTCRIKEGLYYKGSDLIKRYGTNFKCMFIISIMVSLLLPSQHVVDIVAYVSPEQESSCLLAETSKSLPALNDRLSECPAQRMGHPAIKSNLKHITTHKKIGFIYFKSFLKIESICLYQNFISL